MHNNTQSSLALDNSIRHTHLSAQSWQEDNQLNRVNIIRDQYQSRFLVLDQANHMIESVFHRIRLLAHILLRLSLFHSCSLLVQPLLLLSFGLWFIFVEELEGLAGGIAVEDVRKLGDGGRDFETEVEDLLLTL